MKKIILSIVFLSLLNFCFAQDFKKDFRKALNSQDTLRQLSILNNWQQTQPNDPELYVSYLNYYFYKAKKEVIAMTPQQPQGEAFSIKDSTENTVVYLGAKINLNKSILQKGIDKIDEGIALYPNRLDMRFGKIFILGEVKSWDLFTEEIVKTIQHSVKNNNKWLWIDNENLTESKKVLLSSVQGYQQQLYKTENDDLLHNMQRIAKEVLMHYPNHVPSLSDLAITYILQQNYDEALSSLRKAERINPNDGIVLANMAKVYELKEDMLTSKVYYQKIAENSKLDKNLREFAREKLQQFKN